MLQIHPYRIGQAKAGELFGTVQDSVDYSTKRLFQTAICKTDCILLELEHDVFEILIR